MSPSRQFISFLVAGALLLACGFSAPAHAQDRAAALKTVESYLKKVIATNSANASAPKPNAAEQAALQALKARVNEDDILELDRITPRPLAEIRSVNDLNVVMRQFLNPEPYQRATANDAREAERREQISALKQTNATPKIFLSKTNRERMNNLGIMLNEKNLIIVGGKELDPLIVDAQQLAEALKPSASAKEHEALLRSMQELLDEIRHKLGAPKSAATSKPATHP